MKNVLFVIDPVSKLDLRWDNSLALARELSQRGVHCWAADLPQLSYVNRQLCIQASRISPKSKMAFHVSKPVAKTIYDFDLVILRKEPPFDSNYLYATYFLEQFADKIPMVNHPRGIRNTNEKLSILQFAKWIPETLVSSSAEEIIEFQKKIRADLIVKPLDQKGGKGIFILSMNGKQNPLQIKKALAKASQPLLVQRRIRGGKGVEKRIILLHGEILCVFEKRPKPGEFRGNLDLGADFYLAKPSEKEKQMVREMKSYLLKEGLLLAGLDVMADQLIEINVTSPAGLTEAKYLLPESDPVKQWADFLEGLTAS